MRAGDTHGVNSSCIEQFNIIALDRAETHSRLQGLESACTNVSSEMGKISGNGSRGRIDLIKDEMTEVREDVASVTTLVGVIQSSIEKLETRIWKIGLALIGVLGGVQYTVARVGANQNVEVLKSVIESSGQLQ